MAFWQVDTFCAPCQKVSHPTRKDARHARRTHHHGTKAKGLQAYECPHGSGYHLGHRDPLRAHRANLNDPRIRLVPAPAQTTAAAQAMARVRSAPASRQTP